MDRVKALIVKKPVIFLLISCVYIILIAVLKWWIHPKLDTLWFVVGGIIGIYFLDGAELFFQLSPSPFRSVVFLALFAVVSLFVVTSSGSALASGLVLSLYLQMMLWQIGQWRVSHDLSSWYRMVATPVSVGTQQGICMAFCVMFLLETYFFIH